MSQQTSGEPEREDPTEWGGAIDQERIGKTLIEMGERILHDDKDGLGVTGADFTEEFRWNEFTEYAFTIRYTKTQSDRLANPIQYADSDSGEDE